jgi:hypothetical protein
MGFTEVCHYGTSRGDVLYKRYRSHGVRKRAVGGGERNGSRWRRLVMCGECWWFGLVAGNQHALAAGSVQSGGEAARAEDQASAAITIKERI